VIRFRESKRVEAPQKMTYAEAQAELLDWLSRGATEQLKLLLETKHLYQKAQIDSDELKKFAQSLVGLVQLYDHRQVFAAWANNTLPMMSFALLHQELSAAALGSGQLSSPLKLRLPNPSLFCHNCRRREAFAPVWFSDVSGQIRTALATGVSREVRLPDAFQFLLLVYQCQRCLGTPQGFLVTRDRLTFGLHGRSPMELIEVPGYIPNSESSFYRDALIAFETGKKLAGLFYLRTFIEQFGRRVTGKTGRATGEEILDAYYATLPDAHKGYMPSLREWYDKLSEAIHLAKEDDELFEAARTEIERHFDMRRVLKIPEPKPARAAQDAAGPAGT